MSILLPVSNNHPGINPGSFILDKYSVGRQVIDAYGHGKYFVDLRVNKAIGEMIRDFHLTLGCGGNFKNGCLYREEGLPELWRKGDGPVVCDHAVPVSELVKQYQSLQSPNEILKLIFSPVVRIKLDTDRRITGSGYAKNGFINGFPFSRYNAFNKKMIDQGGQRINIVNHEGKVINLETWTESDHWSLVTNTRELEPVLKEITEALEKEKASGS